MTRTIVQAINLVGATIEMGWTYKWQVRLPQGEYCIGVGNICLATGHQRPLLKSS